MCTTGFLYFAARGNAGAINSPSGIGSGENQSGGGLSGGDQSGRGHSGRGQSSGDRKRRFPIPSAIRKRRKNMPEYKSTRPAICYIRDIMCLPRSYRNSDSGNVPIPRTEKRNSIAEAGLIGKVEFRSDMTDQEVRQEICKVFARPMGLTKASVEQGNLFPFIYLQRTGPGSRTLCVPSISSTFQWDGKKVSTLAKSGGIIYILADSCLPEIDEVNLSISQSCILCEVTDCLLLEYLQSEGSSDDDQKLPDKEAGSSENGRCELWLLI